MKDDLISRKRVLDEFEEMNAISFYTLQEDSREAYCELRQVVEQTPSVDHIGDSTKMVRPKGKWTDVYQSARTGYMGGRCSNCQEISIWFGETPNYCGYCRADMRGTDDE